MQRRTHRSALRAAAAATVLACGMNAAEAQTPPARDLLFVGNSFTNWTNVPNSVRELASSAGFAAPNVVNVSVDGYKLSDHRTTANTLSRIALGGWEHVVLQEFSTRPVNNGTDANPVLFKQDATFLYDRIKTSSPDADVLLYETWARAAGHPIYSSTFSNPQQMQAQLRFHYNDAADRYIPENSSALDKDDVRVSPVGDAWERNYASGSPVNLYDTDLYHQNTAGGYLSALVLYRSMYGGSTVGLWKPDALSSSAARDLQGVADSFVVPEPTTLALAAPAAVFVTLRRRRRMSIGNG